MQLVKELFVNLDDRADDKVLVRGKWINMSSETFNKLSSEAFKDEFSGLIDEGVDTIELAKKLCLANKEVILATGKSN